MTTPRPRRRRRLAAALVGAALTLGACATQNPIVFKKPPPPREEARPPKPGSDVFWQSGHWAWKADAELFYWEAGGWVSVNPKRIWIPGYWEPVETEQGRGWRWVDERWEKRQDR